MRLVKVLQSDCCLLSCMWCTAVVDSFQGLCVLDMTTRDHSASDTRHGCTPQVLTFPTAAAHTCFLHTILSRGFLVGHTPKAWTDFLTFSEDPVIRVPHAGERSGTQREWDQRENNERYLLCPSLTPLSDHLNFSFLKLQSNLLFKQH